MDASLRLSLHSSPAFSAALRSHRAAPGRVWLEQASTFGGGPGMPAELARIRLCCTASPLPVSVTLMTRGASGVVVRTASSCANLPPAPRPVCSALEEVALLCKVLAAAGGASTAWPQEALFSSPLIRSTLVVETVRAISSMARQWAAASSLGPSAGVAVAAALEGIVVSAALLGAAAASPRAPVVCDPLPPGFVSGAVRLVFGADPAVAQHPFSLGDGPFDTAALGVALRGVTSLRRCIARLGALSETQKVERGPSVGQEWGACALDVVARALGGAAEEGDGPPLPIETLVLLHWLAVLAPVYVLPPPLGGGGVAAPTLGGGAGGAALRRFSAHAGLPLEPWEGGGEGGLLARPAWDSKQRAAFGVVCSPVGGTPVGGLVSAAESDAPAPLLHGTPAENGFRILQAGLRSQSGTRHEASGAMFGGGVYLTNDVGVALQFTASARGPASFAAVFEAHALATPAVGCFARGNPVPLTRLGDSSGAALPGYSCYLLVPDATHLHIAALHVDLTLDAAFSLLESAGAGGAARADRGRSAGEWGWWQLLVALVVAAISAWCAAAALRHRGFA